MIIASRLHAATGPDRDLDVLIWAEYGYSATGSDILDWDRGLPIRPEHAINGLTIRQAIERETAGIARAWNVPPLTSSIDAVVALIKVKLPGWIWKCGTCSVSDDAWICPDFNDPARGTRLMAEIGYFSLRSVWDNGFDVDRRPPGNVPIALLEAFVIAMDAKAALEKAKAASL